MSTLTRFDGQGEYHGIEVFIETSTGETSSSIRGYARMANKDESTIRERIKTKCGVDDIKYVDIPTTKGLQSAGLISEKLITEWLPSDNPEMTKKLLRWGVRGFMHQVAGYKTKSATNVTTEVEIESEFIKGCKDLKQMQDVLGLSSDDPDYRQALKSLMSQRFGRDAIATPPAVTKAKPSVNYSPTPEVVVPVSNPKALCFVVVANTLITVRKKKQDQDNYMTAGLLTRWSTRLKNVYKKHPTEVAEAMQILCDAGFLKEVAVNCRGAMNYQVVKLPTPADIKQLTPA